MPCYKLGPHVFFIVVVVVLRPFHLTVNLKYIKFIQFNNWWKETDKHKRWVKYGYICVAVANIDSYHTSKQRL